MSLEKRYAEGFLEYARESIGFKKGLEELQAAKSVFGGNPELGKFLSNPAITYEEKCDSLDKIFGKKFSKETHQFLKLLLKKGRIDKFLGIAEYARIEYAHGEEVDAVLNTTYLLDTSVVQSIKDKCEKLLHKKLHLYVELDPTLLGGARMTVGNIIIDGSVKRRLEDLRDKLTAVKVG